MNELFEKIYAASNIETEESQQTELFEQIYKEAEMLNEMNPKLRAMLLGGALAAGLGMQSCSMPTNDPYIPAIENKETQMSAWEELGISEADWNNIIAPATYVVSVHEGGSINAENTDVAVYVELAGGIENARQYIAGSGFTGIKQDDVLSAGVIYFQRGTFAYFIPGDQVQQFYAKGAKQPVQDKLYIRPL